MIVGSIFVIALIIVVAVITLIPQVVHIDAFALLGDFTGIVFAIAIALAIVSFSLSIILFLLAGGNLRMLHRSRFWLGFGLLVTALGGLIWTIFQLIQRIGVE